MMRLSAMSQHLAGGPPRAMRPVASVAEGPLRVGVIGTGGMGGRHADNLSRRVNGATVGGIFDMDKVRASQVATECGGATIFASAEALIASAEIDAVIIASPDSTHAALALSCVRAGKPVLCETGNPGC